MLLIGSNSFIGNYIKEYLKKNNIEFNELNEYSNLKNDIIKMNPECIICEVEKSYGKNIYSTNYIENKLEENLKYNLEIPYKINNIAKELNIHCTHINNGCLYTNNNTTEESEPNLYVSAHSTVCILKEKLLDNCLSLRFRYPISGNFHPGCYLSKLITYSKVLNCDNSISVLQSLMPVMLKLINSKEIGKYNFVNNESINSIELLLYYKYSIDSNCNIEEMTKSEHNNFIGERSNIIVNNDKLNDFCEIESISSSIDKLIINYNNYCKELKICLCCKKDTLKTNINLGYQPLANDFHDKDIICNNYPLHLKYCTNCYHNQLSHAVNPDILFIVFK